MQEITDVFILHLSSSRRMKYTVIPTCKIKRQWFNKRLHHKLNKAPYSHRPTTNMSQILTHPLHVCLPHIHHCLSQSNTAGRPPCIEPTADQWVLTGQGFLFLSYIMKGIAGMICFLSNLLRRISPDSQRRILTNTSYSVSNLLNNKTMLHHEGKWIINTRCVL